MDESQKNLESLLHSIAERAEQDHGYREQLQNNPDLLFHELMGETPEQLKQKLENSLGGLKETLAAAMEDESLQQQLKETLPPESQQESFNKLQEAAKWLNPPASGQRDARGE